MRSMYTTFPLTEQAGHTSKNAWDLFYNVQPAGSVKRLKYNETLLKNDDNRRDRRWRTN